MDMKQERSTGTAKHGETGKRLPETIRKARIDNPKMRERDLALTLGISEAEYIAAWCGMTAIRIDTRVNDILNGVEALGEVMALTRNESAVHEKIGIYDKVHTSTRGAIVLGEDIDLRVFHNNWVHGFAVEKQNRDRTDRSLQFFNGAGEAVHKIHLRPGSNIEAYQALVSSLRSVDQSPFADIVPDDKEPATTVDLTEEKILELRDKWAAMTDVHQFVGLLSRFNISRHAAVSTIDQEFAWQLDGDALEAMMKLSADSDLPIMCFVSSPGCVQIHTGPINQIKQMGPWLNILDPGFHLHLRMDHISELWAVRKPNKDGHVTSLEAYNTDKQLIIQFFGKRMEGQDEREDWRFLMENLPRLTRHVAA